MSFDVQDRTRVDPHKDATAAFQNQLLAYQDGGQPGGKPGPKGKFVEVELPDGRKVWQRAKPSPKPGQDAEKSEGGSDSNSSDPAQQKSGEGKAPTPSDQQGSQAPKDQTPTPPADQAPSAPADQAPSAPTDQAPGQPPSQPDQTEEEIKKQAPPEPPKGLKNGQQLDLGPLHDPEPATGQPTKGANPPATTEQPAANPPADRKPDVTPTTDQPGKKEDAEPESATELARESLRDVIEYSNNLITNIEKKFSAKNPFINQDQLKEANAASEAATTSDMDELRAMGGNITELSTATLDQYAKALELNSKFIENTLQAMEKANVSAEDFNEVTDKEEWKSISADVHDAQEVITKAKNPTTPPEVPNAGGKPVDAEKKPVDAEKKPVDAEKKPVDAEKKPVDELVEEKKPADAQDAGKAPLVPNVKELRYWRNDPVTDQEKSKGIDQATAISVVDETGQRDFRLGYKADELVQINTPDGQYCKLNEGDPRLKLVKDSDKKPGWYFDQKGDGKEFTHASDKSDNKLLEHDGKIVICGNKASAWEFDQTAHSVEKGTFTDKGTFIMRNEDGSVNRLLLSDGTTITPKDYMDINGQKVVKSFSSMPRDPAQRTDWVREGETDIFAGKNLAGKDLSSKIKATVDTKNGFVWKEADASPAQPAEAPAEPAETAAEKPWNDEAKPTADEVKMGIESVTEVNLKDPSVAGNWRLGYNKKNELVKVVTPQNLEYHKLKEGDPRLDQVKGNDKEPGFYLYEGEGKGYSKPTDGSANKFYKHGTEIVCGDKENAWTLDQKTETVQKGKFADAGTFILANKDGTVNRLICPDGTKIIPTEYKVINGEKVVNRFTEMPLGNAGEQIHWDRDRDSKDFIGSGPHGENKGRITDVVINTKDDFDWAKPKAQPAGQPAGTDKPAQPAGQPAAGTDKPAQPAGQPAAGTDKPAQPAGQPAGTDKPAQPAGQPAAGTDKPAQPAEQPAAGTDKPAQPVEQPAAVPNPNEAPPAPPVPGDTSPAPVVDTAPAKGVELSRDQAAQIGQELAKQSADAQKSQKIDGKADLVRSAAPDGGTIAVGNYGTYNRGYHWDAKGNLDMVVVNPGNAAAQTYMRGADGKFYFQPNGADPTNRAERAQDMYVDNKGTLTEVLNGEFDYAQHQPKANSIYRTYGRENDRTFAGLYRSNGTYSKVFYKDGDTQPVEYEGSNSGEKGVNPVHLKRTENTNQWEGTVKNNDGQDSKLVAYNLNIADDNTVRYVDDIGYQRIMSSDGYNVNDSVRGHTFDAAGRLNGISWRNGNSISFTPGDGKAPFVSQHWNGSYMETTVFEQTGKTQKVSVNGTDREIPIWNKIFQIPGYAPANQGEVIFQPVIEKNGHLLDMGRTINVPDGGAFFDWDLNAYINSEYRKRQEEELHKKVLL